MSPLKTEIKARNQEKLSELITYITKHESEIINYELRRQTGKTIGSGRMEKGVEQVIGPKPKTQRYELDCSRKQSFSYSQSYRI